ncbi:MAG: FeoA domain-containing protein [Spirochaetales bacterium]|nr:FeoA domain-containing protein [Spirochaetales bacterium]
MNAEAEKVNLLSNLKPGDKVVVKAIDGGRRLRQKLYGIGIFRGRALTVIRGSKSHPYLVEVGGVKCVIGSGMTDKIIVE